jgi:hypothetical protein
VNLAETNKSKAKESARAEQDAAAAQSATAPASTTPGTEDASAPYGASTQNVYSGVVGEHEGHSPSTPGASPLDAGAASAAGETEHHADANAPAPEPEATAYEPPAYAHAGAGSAVSPETHGAEASTPEPSPVKSQYAHEHDDPPLKPGDVMTHTHERGI